MSLEGVAPVVRVLVVATQIRLPDTHGGSTHVGELVESLRAFGPVHVLARRGSTAEGAVGVSFDMGFPAVVKHLMPLLYLHKALRAARRFKPDAIYERASSYGLGAMISKALGVPMLCMVLDEHYSSLSLKRAGRIVSTKLDIVPERYRHKAVKVSWGANEQRFNPEVSGEGARQRYGLDGLTMCYVGSFKRWHGLDSLVAAAKLLGERDLHVLERDPRDLRYLMIGDGPLRAQVEQDARDAGLGDRFVFTGAVPYEEVPGLIAASDVCLAPFSPANHPRSEEGFILDPLKVFEYLAMAKPTITVNAPNIRALFEDGEHLVMTPPDDPRALAGAIGRLCNDVESAKAMADRGREKVLANHTWRAHAEHLNALFRELIEQGR